MSEDEAWSPGPKVIDIGAGYGGLAHRVVTGLPNVQTYLCTDGVAASTFVCENYLKFRGVDDKATTVPVDEVDEALRTHPPDIALNIHSFSECRIAAIDWWLARLQEHSVRYLMIAPNALDVKPSTGALRP
jgi:hypothetical protein